MDDSGYQERMLNLALYGVPFSRGDWGGSYGGGPNDNWFYIAMFFVGLAILIFAIVNLIG